jgi:hypothetical protein
MSLTRLSLILSFDVIRSALTTTLRSLSMSSIASSAIIRRRRKLVDLIILSKLVLTKSL